MKGGAFLTMHLISCIPVKVLQPLLAVLERFLISNVSILNILL